MFACEQNSKLIGKSRTNMVFVCYLLLKEASIHIILICFDHNFEYPHISHPCPQQTVKKATLFPQKHCFFVEKVFDMYLLLGLSSFFNQNSLNFLKNCHVIVVPLKNCLKTFSGRL